MQTALRRSLLTPFHYWRTISLVLIVGLLVKTITADTLPALLSAIASSFVFVRYENRRWLVMPTERWAGDIALRLLIAATIVTIV